MSKQNRRDERNKFIGMIEGIRAQIDILQDIDYDDIGEDEYESTVDEADALLLEAAELLEERNESDEEDEEEDEQWH